MTADEKTGDLIDKSSFGRWSRDESGLPCFDLDLQDKPAPYYSFPHLMSTGHVCLLADQWGNVNLLTTEGGTICLTPSTGRTRSGLYQILEVSGERYSLLHSELKGNKKIRYGVGYAQYYGELITEKLHIAITQIFLASPERQKYVTGWFTIENLGGSVINARLITRSDIYPRPVFDYQSFQSKTRTDTGEGFAAFTDAVDVLGDAYLLGSPQWRGRSEGTSLMLETGITLKPAERIKEGFYLGYERAWKRTLNCGQTFVQPPDEIQEKWKKKLSIVDVNTPEQWMYDECIWTIGQLLSFSNYDRSVNEYYVNLGGYGFFSDPNNPAWAGFGVREACETAIALAYWDQELSRSSLRWAAKIQLGNGDLPKVHGHRRETEPFSTEFDSDTEIWLIMGCCEYVKTTKDSAFFDERVEYWDDAEDSIWEHMKKAFYWIRDGIGLGAHNHILIREGDWNDYLSSIGGNGKGESVMNSAMACRAFSSFAEFARERKEPQFSEEVESLTRILRSAVQSAFDERWFIRAYNDEGTAIGTFAEGRLFLNAQTWAVLGGCGTKEQRRAALMNAVELCHTDIGLTLMSKPYSSPPPSGVSWCPIPAGEGENAGIWPQTAYWLVWALAEEGFLEAGLEEWICMTLRKHSARFPEVPFGIYNGPDCYSSHFAGLSEGWTQVQVFNRIVGTPMLPVVAWQAFAMKKLNEAGMR